MLNLNAHQVLKDCTDKQFHDTSATEFFLQTEREVATEEMKEGSGTVGHMELREGLQERKKYMCTFLLSACLWLWLGSRKAGMACRKARPPLFSICMVINNSPTQHFQFLLADWKSYFHRENTT